MCMLGGDHFGSRPSVRPASVGCLSFPLPNVVRGSGGTFTHKRALIAIFFFIFSHSSLAFIFPFAVSHAPRVFPQAILICQLKPSVLLRGGGGGGGTAQSRESHGRLGTKMGGEREQKV